MTTGHRPAWLLTAALALALAGCATGGAEREQHSGMAEAEAAWRAEQYGRALPILHREADRGSARAQYAIGYMYYRGQGVERDLDQALEWIRLAAGNGNREAVEALGRLAGSLSMQGRGRRALSREPDPADEP